MSRMEGFATFMARALYDPERGYYTRRIQTVGARGDFSTAATLSPLLGQAVAAWLVGESVQQPQVRHVIEVGAGDGALMRAVRSALGAWRRWRWCFHIVETSPVLRARQQEMLGGTVTWHEEMGTALQAADGAAFIFHNELIDAFPVNLVQWDAAAQSWQEVWVQEELGHTREELRDLNWTLPQQACFSVLREWRNGQPPPHGRQRCELHSSVRRWLHDWAPVWRQGAMLTLDYGDVFPALYHRRPQGTLRAYLLQQRLEGAAICQNIGRQDITADVNFTDYRDWARALGWREAGYGTLAEFIQRWLPAQSCRGGLHCRLLSPDGAGGAFKHVLHHPGA